MGSSGGAQVVLFCSELADKNSKTLKMLHFLTVLLLAFGGHARRVQETISQPSSSSGKSLAAMLLAIPARMPLARNVARASHSKMGGLPKAGVWDVATKKIYFDAWDPEKPRGYNNFNPFERDDEGALCDMNGCFPGTSRGYQAPTRPEQSWEIMQEEAKLMDALKAEAKWNIKGRPGNFHLGWQDDLDRPQIL